jgi:hypothetical protein
VGGLIGGIVKAVVFVLKALFGLDKPQRTIIVDKPPKSDRPDSELLDELGLGGGKGE